MTKKKMTASPRRDKRPSVTLEIELPVLSDEAAAAVAEVLVQWYHRFESTYYAQFLSHHADQACAINVPNSEIGGQKDGEPFWKSPVRQREEWFKKFLLIEASEVCQAESKRREGSLWSSLGYVGNGFLLSTYPHLSIGTRMHPRPSTSVIVNSSIILSPLTRLDQPHATGNVDNR